MKTLISLKRLKGVLPKVTLGLLGLPLFVAGLQEAKDEHSNFSIRNTNIRKPKQKNLLQKIAFILLFLQVMQISSVIGAPPAATAPGIIMAQPGEPILEGVYYFGLYNTQTGEFAWGRVAAPPTDPLRRVAGRYPGHTELLLQWQGATDEQLLQVLPKMHEGRIVSFGFGRQGDTIVMNPLALKGAGDVHKSQLPITLQTADVPEIILAGNPRNKIVNSRWGALVPQEYGQPLLRDLVRTTGMPIAYNPDILQGAPIFTYNQLKHGHPLRMQAVFNNGLAWVPGAVMEANTELPLYKIASGYYVPNRPLQPIFRPGVSPYDTWTEWNIIGYQKTNFWAEVTPEQLGFVMPKAPVTTEVIPPLRTAGSSFKATAGEAAARVFSPGGQAIMGTAAAAVQVGGFAYSTSKQRNRFLIADIYEAYKTGDIRYLPAPMRNSLVPGAGYISDPRYAEKWDTDAIEYGVDRKQTVKDLAETWLLNFFGVDVMSPDIEAKIQSMTTMTLTELAARVAGGNWGPISKRDLMANSPYKK